MASKGLNFWCYKECHKEPLDTLLFSDPPIRPPSWFKGSERYASKCHLNLRGMPTRELAKKPSCKVVLVGLFWLNIGRVQTKQSTFFGRPLPIIKEMNEFAKENKNGHSQWVHCVILWPITHKKCYCPHLDVTSVSELTLGEVTKSPALAKSWFRSCGYSASFPDSRQALIRSPSSPGSTVYIKGSNLHKKFWMALYSTQHSTGKFKNSCF